MEKKLLTEINNMRRIMGLELLMEGPKDEIYQLLKKFTSKETTQIEKNEIESLLKKAGVNDNELKLLKQGQETILSSLSGRLVGKITGELAQEFEEKILQKGIPTKALSRLDGGPKLISKIEELHTKYLKGELNAVQYEAKIKKIKDGLSGTLNREELERAIKSIEVNNEYRIKNPTGIDDVISQIETPPRITPEEVLPDRPFETPSPTPAKDFLKFYGEEELKRAEKWFKGMTIDGIDELFRLYRDRYQRDTLSEIEKKKIEDFIATIGKNKLQTFWYLQSNWGKALLIIVALEGTNALYFALKVGIPKSMVGLIPIIGPFLVPSDEEKQKEEKTQEITDYLLKLENYRVLSKDGKKLSDIDNFYLNKLIDDFGTIQNDLKNKITSKIKSLVDSKKGTLDFYGMYQFGEEVANEINKILLTVPETNNFKVQVIKEGDDDYLKPGIKTTLKSLKNILVLPDNIKQKASWEQNKNQGGKPFYTPDIPSDL